MRAAGGAHGRLALHALTPPPTPGTGDGCPGPVALSPPAAGRGGSRGRLLPLAATQLKCALKPRSAQASAPVGLGRVGTLEETPAPKRTGQ